MATEKTTYALFDGQNQISAAYDDEAAVEAAAEWMRKARPDVHIRQVSGPLTGFPEHPLGGEEQAPPAPGATVSALRWLRDFPTDAAVAEVGLPTDAAQRKATPMFSGVLAYFPDALVEVARVSLVGNQQHNPGQPLHWAKEKSRDEADALVRHLLEHGTRDADGQRHSAKVAWRALALLQREIDAECGFDEEYYRAQEVK